MVTPYGNQNSNVLWFDGNQTRSWMRADPVLVTNVSIVNGIFGFTGISSRTVHNIPSLLQTNWASQELLNRVASPKLLGDEAVNGADCYHISGVGKAGRRFEIWIGKADYLIRKVRTTSTAFQDAWDEEVHQDITVNQKIPDKTFNLAPDTK